MNRHGFIAAGCWTIDRIKLIDRWPAEEELALIGEVDRQGGGSAHNVGIDLRKLDSSLPVATIGLLGNDADGDFLFAQATHHGLDTTQLHRTSESATSYTDVMSVMDTGKRTFFHHQGCNDLLNPAHFDFSQSSARILHLGLLGIQKQMDAPAGELANGWCKVLRDAREQGLATSIEMVSIDPARNREIVQPCLEHLDYLIVNDHEIGSIANLDTVCDGQTHVAACEEAAARTLAMGRMQLVAVHYPEGAFCLTRSGEHYSAPSLTVPSAQIVSSVGAGDAFVAGFLYAIHQLWPVADALKLGHCVAAVSLRAATTVGAVESVARCKAIVEGW